MYKASLQCEFSCGFKPFTLCETFSTLLACVWLLSSVNSHVLFKVSFVSKIVSTLFAGERFLFSVNSHVHFKGYILSKTFPQCWQEKPLVPVF